MAAAKAIKGVIVIPSQKSRRILKAMMAVHPLMDQLDIQRQRRAQDSVGMLVRPPKGVRFLPVPDAALPMQWAVMQHSLPMGHAVLYCHGGAYMAGSLRYTRALSALLANEAGIPVLSFEYRLAPEHPYPAALEDALAAWDYLLLQGFAASGIAVVGESAGGNLALALAQRLKQQGRELPAQLLLMSPWVDLTHSGPSFDALAGQDPSLSQTGLKTAAQSYAGGLALDDPAISPLFGDMSGLPPTLIQVGTQEILLSDSIRLAELMNRAGTHAMLETWEGMCHVFQLYPFAESQAALSRAGQFLKRLQLVPRE